jgi:alpha-1,2-glucosyltransferase
VYNHVDRNYRYLISKLEKPLLGCETSNLRILNSQALVFIFLLSYGILQACNNRKKRATTAGESPDPVDNQKRVHDIHSAFNIALFPPLFFFSALYYTDVMSTMIVLVSYWAYLGKTKARDEVTTIFIGVLALFFRQTNIFWVAIFPAGLAVVDVLKKSAEHNANPGKGNSQAILRESWSKGTVYDCPVQDAGPQGAYC